MLSPEGMWNELVFQARLRYLMFKRCVWAFETLMVVLVAMAVYTLPLTDTVRFACIFLAVLRAVGEGINHFFLARVFGAADTWHQFPFI